MSSFELFQWIGGAFVLVGLFALLEFFQLWRENRKDWKRKGRR